MNKVQFLRFRIMTSLLPREHMKQNQGTDKEKNFQKLENGHRY